MLAICYTNTPLQATQPIVADNATKEGDYSVLTSLFEISGIRLEIIKYIGYEDKEENTALHSSIRLRYVECVKYFATSILFPDTEKGYAYFVKYLRSQDPKINARAKNGGIALFLSALKGHLHCPSSFSCSKALISVLKITIKRPLCPCVFATER